MASEFLQNDFTTIEVALYHFQFSSCLKCQIEKHLVYLVFGWVLRQLIKPEKRLFLGPLLRNRCKEFNILG